jgi:hypothetical protein
MDLESEHRRVREFLMGKQILRCIRVACGGLLATTGEEVTRLICEKCGQNYVMIMHLEPVSPREPPKALPGGDRAE